MARGKKEGAGPDFTFQPPSAAPPFLTLSSSPPSLSYCQNTQAPSQKGAKPSIVRPLLLSAQEHFLSLFALFEPRCLKQRLLSSSLLRPLCPLRGEESMAWCFSSPGKGSLPSASGPCCVPTGSCFSFQSTVIDLQKPLENGSKNMSSLAAPLGVTGVITPLQSGSESLSFREPRRNRKCTVCALVPS